MPALGRPHRPKPDDFREMFVRLGWEAAEHYGTHSTRIARWVDEEGREALIAARKLFVSRRRRSNYVMGRRLSSLKRTPAVV